MIEFVLRFLIEGSLLFQDLGESGAPAVVKKSHPLCSFNARAKAAQPLPSPILKFVKSLYLGLSLNPLLCAQYQPGNHLSALLKGIPIRLLHIHSASAVKFRILSSSPCCPN